MRHDLTHAESSPNEPPRPKRAPVRSLGWAQSFAVGDAVDVSVCIANWNCKELLRDCLRSLLEQPQGIALEVIVVDNNSTDGAAEMVAAEFPEVLLVKNTENRGFSRANNQAAAKARGRYLFFLNNDTVTPARSLGRLVDFADVHPEVGMIGPRLRDADGRMQISYRETPTVGALLHRTLLFRWTALFRRSYRQYRRSSFRPDTLRRVAVLMGAAVLLPRRVFNELGGWNEQYEFGGEDIELSHRVNQFKQVVYLPAVEITHYGRASSRLNAGFTDPNVEIGYARFLRETGTRRGVLAFYKLAVICDAPLQIIAKFVQLTWRKFRGQSDKAAKTALALTGFRAFLRGGVGRFWRA